MLLEEGVCYDQCVLLAKLCEPLPCFILYSKAKFACYSRCFLTSSFCIPVPYNEKDNFFGVSSKRSCRRRQRHPTPVLLSGGSHGRRSLVGCSPWGRKESDTTVQLHFRFSLLCIGEGNGNSLQCSCLENPRDRGAWWAAIMRSHRVGHN